MGISQAKLIKAIEIVLRALNAQGGVGKAVSAKVSRELFPQRAEVRSGSARRGSP